MAKAVLMKNKWSVDKSVEAFAKDPDYIENTFKFKMEESEQNMKADCNGEHTCGVCFCEYGEDEWVTIKECGHGLCKYCFTGYLESKIGDGKESIFTYCPEAGCNNLCPESHFRELLSEEQFARYSKFLNDSFVDLQDDIIWCPGVNCNKVFKVKPNATCEQSITCEDCGEVFCPKCSKKAHYPLDCESNETW